MDEATPMRRAEALLRLQASLQSFGHIKAEMEGTQRHVEALMAEVDRQIEVVEKALAHLRSVRQDLEGVRQAQARTAETVGTWYGHTQNEIAEAVAVLMAESGERWDRLRREGKL